MCLAYKKEDDTEWEQVSFVSNELRTINGTLSKDNFLKVIHSVTDKPVEKCSSNSFQTEKNWYEDSIDGWKVTHMFYFELPNKLSIYFERPFEIKEKNKNSENDEKSATELPKFVKFDKKAKYNVIMNYGVFTDPNS